MVAGQRVLVVEPDETAAARIDWALRTAGASSVVVADAETGWRAFAASPAQMVITALTTPRRDGAWLLRRIRDEYIGEAPRAYAVASQEELSQELRELDLDGLLLRPVSPESLFFLVSYQPAEEPVARQAARWRDLLELSFLGGELDTTLKALVDRIAFVFRTTDCVLWNEGRGWTKMRRVMSPEEQSGILERCELAVTCGCTVFASVDKQHGAQPSGERASACRSYFGASLLGPGAHSVGAICLVSDSPRQYGHEERDALRILARRLAIDLAWRTAHDRLVDDHASLRQKALLDPLLGIWTRHALEEALRKDLAKVQRSGGDLCLGILDIEQLRKINERFGHKTGDAALMHLVSVIRSSIRAHDYVGRVAGDGVCVVLGGASAEQAHDRLEGLRRAISQTPLAVSGEEIPVRVRIGATSLCPNDDDPGRILARAADALQRAKVARAPMHFAIPGDDINVVAASASGGGAESTIEIGASGIPAGTTLGGMYQVLHEISRGAMGVVYRAEDLGLGRPVAIKVLRPDLALDADLVSRFRAEAAMLAALRHENLVQVYAFGSQGEAVFFVMELVEGEALSDVLRRADEEGQPPQVDLVNAVVTQIAGALDAMHRAGAVHRDVKPANILLDRVRDRAVLVDVGVAKRTGTSTDIAGTPGFAAPESFTGGGEGPATDVYGLATTAYMMLTGLAPFGGGDVTKVVRRQLSDAPAIPTSLRPDLSPAVDRTLLRALAPSAADRYANAVEFALTLGEALLESPRPPPSEPAPMHLSSEFSLDVSVDSEESTGRCLPMGVAATSEELPCIMSARGALFRTAYRVLGTRLGSGWIRRACEREQSLRDVLGPTVSPLGWYPIDRLVTLLRSIPSGSRDHGRLARELGKVAMSATFARFLGADPASLSFQQILDLTQLFWYRYHSWGRIHVKKTDEQALITIADTPREPLICAFVEGSFERIAELTGAFDAQAAHVACEVNGSTACAFEVRWKSVPAKH
ncbi:MAG: diguanylate cyclase [Pseudomonadota bacterium]